MQYLCYLTFLSSLPLYLQLLIFHNMYQQTLDTPLAMAIDTNEPKKKPSSNHVQELIATIYFIISLVLGIYFGVVDVQVEPAIMGVIIGQGYLVYLIIAICCNKTRQYLDHIKSFQQYETAYYSMTKTPAHFVFHTTCYHYETRITHHHTKDANGNDHTEVRTHQQKVITHTATQNLNPRQCTDESGHIEGIYENKSLVFFHYIPRFYFGNLNSQQYFQSLFRDFIARNNRDVHQDSSYDFVIPGFEERICFYTRERVNATMFYLTGFLGLAYIYSILNERRVARYEIEIIKKILLC